MLFSLAKPSASLQDLQSMKTFNQTQYARKLSAFVIATLLAWVGPSSNTEAISPAPDGGYPGGNTAEGQNALFNLTTGIYNTGVGLFSLRSNTGGNFNTAIGAGTLLANTTDRNTATGAGVLLSNTIGFDNTGNGAFALFSNTTGSRNTATGVDALVNNNADFNTANGDSALASNTEGEGNIAVGGTALTTNTMLNRSTDGGATWTLNGMPGGIIVANADSTQPTPKFGTVNALLGGVDHAAVDPNNGDIYYVYGNRDPGTGNDRLAIRRIEDDGVGGVTVGPENFVTGQVEAAIPSVAVAGSGTVGVFYYTFDGFSVDEFPIFTAHFASSDDQAVTFTDVQLVTFLSSAKDCNVDPSFCQPGADPERQRVLGDYMRNISDLSSRIGEEPGTYS